MEIPPALLQPRWRPLMCLQLQVPLAHVLGATPNGDRRMAPIASGTFEGERLRGVIVEGSDWLTVRSDGAWVMDVRALLRTDDEALIALHYRGFRHGPSEIIERLARQESVNPEDYYFRISPLFETSSPKYDWLNRIVAVGLGHRLPHGPMYNLFELL